MGVISDTGDAFRAMRALAAALMVAVVVLAVTGLLTSRKLRVEQEKRTLYYTSEETRRKGLVDRVSRMFEGSGVPLTAREIANLWGCATIVPPLVLMLFGAGGTLALVAAAIGFLVPIVWLRGSKKRNKMRFGDDLGQVLPLVASNLKGGLSLRQALTPVGENMDQPIKGEFEILGRDIDRGMPVDVALVHMAERNENSDTLLLASAVAAQRESGGNLAEIVDTVANTVRVRTRLRRDIRSKTSQARATAKILAAMPVVMFFVLCGMNSVYRDFYSTPAGWGVLAVSALLILIGFVIFRKMADIQAD